MKPGDLVKLVSLPPYWRDVGFEIGDIAILTEVDWEAKGKQNTIKSQETDKLHFERGRFYFPLRQNMFKFKDEVGGYLLLYENVEVISETR